MSFSKAKLQRFNEQKVVTPSPATYNVSTREKIRMGIISKAGTYVKKPESPHSSETGSVHSTPCFQTPTVPRRKKLLGLSFRSSKNVDQEELRDKIVECNNKDSYIKDLTEQIEDMTLRITSLQQDTDELRKRRKEVQLMFSKKCDGIAKIVGDISGELGAIRQGHCELRDGTVTELATLATSISQFQQLFNVTIEEGRREVEKKNVELKTMEQKYVEKTELLKKQHKEELKVIAKKLSSSEDKVKKLEDNFKDLNALTQLQMQEKLEEIDGLKKQNSEEIDVVIKKLEESEANVQMIQEQLQDANIKIKQKSEEMDDLRKQHEREVEKIVKQLEESEAKVALLEENFNDVNLLTDLQMKQKVDEIEDGWRHKLEEKEKEYEAILKECQEISEYNIIQSEIEKNMLKKGLAEKQEAYSALVSNLKDMKTEQHAYQLSITTFRDTIEVLKKRLIDSDRDVEQLKEELERNEDKLLVYEKKCIELSNQLNETLTANEELEMQYESTSKIMQNEIATVEMNLLAKVEALKKESRELLKDKQLLCDVLEQYHEQQSLISEAQEIFEQSKLEIAILEEQCKELETEVMTSKSRVAQETEEAAAIRKKYIEKSGKYDELAHQFEQLLQELDIAKEKTEELEKIQYVHDLNMKSSELFRKNMDLEARNFKLNKTIEKLRREVEELRKPGMKLKVASEDKENLGSPKCAKGVPSPGPLKVKN